MTPSFLWFLRLRLILMKSFSIRTCLNGAKQHSFIFSSSIYASRSLLSMATTPTLDKCDFGFGDSNCLLFYSSRYYDLCQKAARCGKTLAIYTIFQLHLAVWYYSPHWHIHRMARRVWHSRNIKIIDCNRIYDHCGVFISSYT